jgi:hypothetical protein
MAYALSLHEIDGHASLNAPESRESGDDTNDNEERRRAWWAIFHMDNFASFIGGRPPNIDISRSDVLLPVSDEAWYGHRQVQSACIRYKGIEIAWSSLVDKENQDGYAWFLIASYICRSTQETIENRDRSVAGLSVVQSAIQCFTLGLPPQLRPRAGNMIFKEDNFHEKNWAMCIHFVIQRYFFNHDPMY